MKGYPLFTILQSLLTIALPISAGRILNILANFIAMMMVAKFGKTQLAAGFLAVSSTIPVTTSVLTIFYAIGIRICYYRGQKNAPESIGALVKNGLFLAIILAIPAAVLITYLDAILSKIGLDPELIALTKAYFYYAGLGVFPLLAMTVLGQFYIGIGKPWFALMVEVISFPLTILASWALIPGHFGLPGSGLAGVSLANLLVQSVLFIAILIITSLNKTNAVYQIFKKPFTINWRTCQSIITLGLPIGIQFGGELAAMAVAGWLMGYYGVDALAALQITSQYSILIIMPGIGLAQALTLKISELYGQQGTHHYPIKKYLYASVLLLASYVVPVSFLYCTLSTKFAEFYLGSNSLRPDFEQLIHVFFILAAVFLSLDGIRNLLSSALRGLHQSKPATIINLASLWLISIPVSGLTVFVFKANPVALRMGFLSGFVMAVLALAWYLYTHIRQVNPSSSLVNLSRTVTP